MFNLDYMLLMKEYNIKVLAFPPHVSHVLQPLDKAPFSSLKRWWNYYLGIYNQDHAGRKLPKAEWFQVFTPAWEAGLTVKNVIAGFNATGVFPVNPQAIKAWQLGPSATTDKGMSVLMVTLLCWMVWYGWWSHYSVEWCGMVLVFLSVASELTSICHVFYVSIFLSYSGLGSKGFCKQANIYRLVYAMFLMSL